jgi:hypothetical protein
MAVLSFKDMNLVSTADKPFEFAYIDPNTQKETEFKVKVIGSHSNIVTDAVLENADAQRRSDKLSERKGKEIEIRKAKDDVQFSVELTAKRIIGWSGIDIDYSPEKAIELCTINPELRKQVNDASDEIKNFTAA